MDTSGFVPRGNLNTDSDALKKSGRSQTIKRVLTDLYKYRMHMIASLMLAAISVIFTLLVPIRIGNAIDALTDKTGVLSNLVIAAVYAVIVGVSQFMMNLINNRITYNTVMDLRNQAIRKIQHLPLKVIDSNSQGDIVSRVVADADQFADGLLLGFTQAFTGVMTIVVTLVIMFSMNAIITLVVIFVTPLSIFIARFISKRTYSMFGKQSILRGKQTALIDEMITNAKTVKAFSKEKEVRDRFDTINEDLSSASLKAIFYSSLTNPCTRFVNAVCYALVALCGAYFCLSDVTLPFGIYYTGTVGTLTVFLAYANQYTKPFNEISSVISELQNALACAARVFEIIDKKSEVSDSESAVLDDCKGFVDAKGVDFSYDPKKELIKDLNISVKPGQRVAIVGPTGCGKTTIINLLMRFYDVDGGSIDVDHADIRSYTRKSLRRSYGMVLQDTWLKRGTVMENIRIARPDATDEEVMEAAKATHAHGFIRRLENGYDTLLAEDGGSLSQGQKQLLCITRVMLNLPPMLILDEATSSIDTRTEMQIQSAFNALMKDKTSFIVAHRLSTIKNADIILVMKDGKIIETGDHDTLLEKGGFYKQLWLSGKGEEDGDTRENAG
ncbi:MAG: ABC transporter ATP-binding protein/permease [Lachnospiraceae bacterium]|nr:ABC transporter ATP-binding protein/permease [Lachnospiraceae bacterium]